MSQGRDETHENCPRNALRASLLLNLANDKTEQLYLASISTALPDVRNGIRIRAS